MRLVDHLPHGGGGVQQVEALAFDHLQRHGGFAVEAGNAGAILECQADFGQIAQCHNPLTIDFDRQGINVARFIKGRRDFNRKRALGAVYLACGDQHVIVAHHVDQFRSGDVVGFKAQRVDHNLDHFIARSGNPGFQHSVQPFDLVLQVFGDLKHGAFGDIAGQVHDDDGKFGKVDFVDGIFFRPIREFAFGGGHGVAHIGQHLGFIPAKFKFQRHARVPLGRGRGHGFQPVQIGKFRFHRFDQQGFAVFGGNAGKGDRYEKSRDFDIRLSFFGQVTIGRPACRQGQDDKGHDHAGAGGGPIDHSGHCATS